MYRDGLDLDAHRGGAVDRADGRLRLDRLQRRQEDALLLHVPQLAREALLALALAWCWKDEVHYVG